MKWSENVLKYGWVVLAVFSIVGIVLKWNGYTLLMHEQAITALWLICIGLPGFSVVFITCDAVGHEKPKKSAE